MNNEAEYTVMCQRIEELLCLVDDETPKHNHNMIELNLLSNLVADYEDLVFPISNLCS